MTRNSVFTLGIATLLCATLRLASAQEPPKNFIFVDEPAPVAEISFDDAEGQMRKLADFKGKVLLVNIWATWCGPCRTEMPALDRLQARLGGSHFEVIPVSIDRGGIEAISKFYSEIGVRNLAMYIDPSGQVLRQTRALGLPTTLLIDRSGKEIGRLIGPVEWDAPEITEFLSSFIQNKNLPDRADRGDSPQPECQDAPNLLVRSLRWLRICLTDEKPGDAPMNLPQIETAMLQARFTPGALLRNRWVLVAVAVLALVGIVAASWNWLVAAGLATILVSALPCLVMCGLGLCMHRFLGGSGSSQASGSATADPPEGMARATTDGSATYAASCCGGAILLPPVNVPAEGVAETNEKSET